MTDTSKLSACCQQLVESYRAIQQGDERDRAALFCPTCIGRVTLNNGVWSRS